MATGAISTNASAFGPMSAQRVLIFGGIALITGGMLFGDIFAVFVLHQNGGQTGEALLAASRAVAAGNSLAVKDSFQRIGGLLEDHGTKVDAHVHMTDAGYLALLLALLQPYVALPKKRKRLLAWWFVAGGVLLPTGIFLIHYVGLAYSPSSVIGWASVLADVAGAVLIAVMVAEGWGLGKHFLSGNAVAEPTLPKDHGWERRVLLSCGTLLVLLGFLYGAWYAAVDLYEHEARETRILRSMLDHASSGQGGATMAVADYGSLAAEKAVKIAAHSHIIKFGLLAILLSFIQPHVYLSEIWKRRCVVVLLAGSVILPVFVLLELKLGLFAGGIADAGGLMVIVALIGMLVGVLRYSGSVDGAAGGHLNAARRILIFGGLILAAFGMLYGLHYAVFVEHQTLDRMGGSLATAFVHAAEGHSPEAERSLESYVSTKYDYVRQVDSHSHWIGLAMLLIVLGAIFDYVSFPDHVRLCIAVALVGGAVAFPLGVLLQTLSHGAFLASALAVLGSASVTIALAIVAWGLAAKRA